MKLEGWAYTLLMGTRWDEKLARLNTSPLESAVLAETPRFPGRPPAVARIGKADFPKRETLHENSSRARCLHFFANHELLAMELMALVLLKFPEAPNEFRLGIARTIQEEQSHLGLYIARMRELGMDFGDLPVSDYFWNAMKNMRSPLEFVVQMSLTLEQANLDFSLFYRDEMTRVGDEKTAALLDRVYQEEIGHVKHGLGWFNRWRKESQAKSHSGSWPDAPLPPETEWASYLRLLPPPMTPRRAKGLIFSTEARQRAGFSDSFIRELEVYGGSKGRPPVFWLYNPTCEAEIARGKPGYSPSQTVSQMILDQETLPLFLARTQDVVLVRKLPSAEWLRSLARLGFDLPEFRVLNRSGDGHLEARIGGFQPWGWSPESFELFRPWRERLTALEGAPTQWCRRLLSHDSFSKTGIAELFSKSKWLEPTHRLCRVFSCAQDAIDFLQKNLGAETSVDRAGKWIVKAPWGTSGTQNKRVLKLTDLNARLEGWIRNTVAQQGSILIEAYLDKVADLSIQLEVLETSETQTNQDDKIKLLGARVFRTGPHMQYRATELDPKLGSLSVECLRFLHSGPLETWRRHARKLGLQLQASGYRGPVGIDALIARSADGTLSFEPQIEVNPRWTMGRLALELESHLLPGVPARWQWFRIQDLKKLGFSSIAEIIQRFPVQTERARLREGVVFTNNPESARSVLSVLLIGSHALRAFDPFIKS